MNHKLDELTKSMPQAVTRRTAFKRVGLGLAGMAMFGLLALPVGSHAAALGPLTELSRPNAVGNCDSGFVSLPGNWTLDDALEPVVAVNPVNPRNIVAAWIQGLFQNIIAAVSFNGGQTWQQVPIPFTVCSGGPVLGSGDPWLSFAPNGDLHLVAIAGDSLANRAIAAIKSTDGGLHWSTPIPVSASTDLTPDHPSLTADPTDARFAYAIWDTGDAGGRGASAFTRTTDGGLTWEAARTLVRPSSHNAIQFSQILVLPDGTLRKPLRTVLQHPNEKTHHRDQLASGSLD